MTWTKLDDGIFDHPKMLRAGEDAANLYVRALVYCNKHLTDGRIFPEVLATLTRRRDVAVLAQRLVDVAAWESHPDGGWIVHDFHAHNPTAEEVNARRAEISRKRAEAGKRGGIASAAARSNEANPKQGASKPEATPKQPAEANGKPRPVPSRPVPQSYDGAVAPSPPDDAKPSPGGSDDAPAGAPAEPAKGRRRSEPRPDAAAPLPGTAAARAVASLVSTSRLREIVRRPHALCAAAVEAYPAVNVPTEIARAEAWLVANPMNAKRDGDRYLNAWLSRAQEKAPRVGGNDTSPAVPQRAPSLPWARPEPVQSGTNRTMIDGVWYDRATQHEEIEALLAKKFGGRRNG